jgi:hypothetical protein
MTQALDAQMAIEDYDIALRLGVRTLAAAEGTARSLRKRLN